MSCCHRLSRRADAGLCRRYEDFGPARTACRSSPGLIVQGSRSTGLLHDSLKQAHTHVRPAAQHGSRRHKESPSFMSLKSACQTQTY